MPDEDYEFPVYFVRGQRNLSVFKLTCAMPEVLRRSVVEGIKHGNQSSDDRRGQRRFQ
jgi:hypothetical protein